MKLSEFLNRLNAKEEDITTYSGADALKAVEADDYALRYVKDQTPDICLKAVERNGYALRFVNPAIFDAE